MKQQRVTRLKRVVDFCLASAGLVVSAPVLFVTAAAIRLTMGKPILFRQQRPGLYARPFVLIKFRTMSLEREGQNTLLNDAQRLTRFGKFLRATSIDELPQLLNVLRGDMSLVGPRPLLMQYLPRYTLEQMRRHDVKPGITGWAQVHGRNSLSWEEKFALDVWYVDHQSFWLDLKIIALTALKVFRHEGISQQGHATMPEFMGSSKDTISL